MGLRIIVGTVLVLATWSLLVVVAVVLGRWAVVLVERHRAPLAHLRASLWWGLTVGTVIVLALSLTTGLGSGAAGIAVTVTVILVGSLGLLLRRPRRIRLHRPGVPALALIAALAASTVYLAVKALGPVTNYDTGLYHLGSVKYATDFSAVPGLATLFFPFGYANAQFPLAAILGNGPWDGVGYRLLNGLLVLLVATDLVLRLLSRRRRWGTYVLSVGVGATLIPLVAMADALVASPTSDTAVLLLTLVAVSYLADLLEKPGPAMLEASVVLLTTALTVTLRPTMGFFAIGVLLVLAARLWRQSSRAVGWLPWAITGGILLALVVLIVLRDRMLSGWLLYPLSVLPLDVPWRSPDPTTVREATLAAARDPGDPDQYAVAHSWSWISAWMGRLPSQWETWYVAVGLIVTAATVVAARRRALFPRRPRVLLASLLPSGLAVAAWFTLSPPSFRFIWGPLFTAVFLVLGSAARDLDWAAPVPNERSPRHLGLLLAGSAAVVLAVTGYSAIARSQIAQVSQERAWTLAGIEVPYAIAPVPMPPVLPVTKPSGLVIITPESGSDQCWDNYPLCTVNPPTGITLRGDTLQDGFVTSR